MQKKFFAFAVAVLISRISSAQHPLRHWTEAIETRYDSKQPVVDYMLSVDSTDFSSFSVEMRVRNVADTFYVAMVAHPEYDDRYWRYVEDFFADTKHGKGKVIREDSALWKIITDGREAILHYRIHLPATEGIRSSWKAYLTPTGGLVGGPHSFMYVVGHTLVPSHVTLKIPAEWQIATGLQSTSDPNTFFAPSVAVLTDDPIFIGKFKSWAFTIDNTPHRLIYWSLTEAVSFDTTALLSSVQKLTEQANLLFGRFPYREYSFMLQDGAVGSLEHNNSVTVGALSSQLAKDMTGSLSEIAHEYFHTWNLMRIRPVEYGDVSYQTPPLSKGLWFSEGLTIFYADLLMRRAGLRVFDSTRITHFENLIRRYFTTPAYLKFSAEKISMAAYGPPGMLGNYSAGTHLQGEVLGSLLDFIIRDATNGKLSMDNVMREMMKRFSSEKGFTSKDIEQVISDVCKINVHQFFLEYVYGHKQVDFNKYLRLIGLQYTMEWKTVLANDGKQAADLRVYSYQLPGESITRIGITNPTGCWAKAGLNTGDIIITVNGKPVTSGFRSLIVNTNPGEEIVMEVKKPSGLWKTTVIVSDYQQPVASLHKINNPSAKQKKLFEQWITVK